MTCAPRLIKGKLGTYICASRSKGNYLSSTVSIVLSHYCGVEYQLLSKLLLNYVVWK